MSPEFRRALLFQGSIFMDSNILEYQKRILNRIFQNISLTCRENVIDVGCGDGSDCDFFLTSTTEVVGIDIKFNSNWRKKKKEKIEFSVADACNLPFRDESFELVFEKDALHHVTDHVKAFEEILRITKTSGYIICVEANRYNPIFYVHMTLMRGHQHFSKDYFTKLMKAYSKHVDFLVVDSRVYPTKNKRLLKLIHYFEDFVEAFPIVRNFACYNIAIIKKV
jgi:ubiquinone/menaquinone biosynthesis C-methylase UbiE